MGKTRKQYRDLGARHACDKVNAEGASLVTRWETHLEVLRTYGKGRQALDAFKALLAEHTAKLETRPGAVAAKLAAVAASRTTHDLADEVVDKARAILADAAKTNGAVEQDLAAALAADGKAAIVAALAAHLTTHRALLPADCDAETLARQAQELAAALRSAGPAKADAKTATKADTEEIDVLDGRVIEVISEVNSVGRKAFRRLRNKAMVEAFKYHHVVGKPSETAPSPTTPATTQPVS
jgi:hypothetical protein